jgi:peptidyl-tRNA hydrolase
MMMNRDEQKLARLRAINETAKKHIGAFNRRLLNMQEFGFNSADFSRHETNRKIELPIDLAIEIHAKLKEIHNKGYLSETIRDAREKCCPHEPAMSPPPGLHNILMDHICNELIKAKEEKWVAGKELENAHEKNQVLLKQVKTLKEQNEKNQSIGQLAKVITDTIHDQ